MEKTETWWQEGNGRVKREFETWWQRDGKNIRGAEKGVAFEVFLCGWGLGQNPSEEDVKGHQPKGG